MRKDEHGAIWYSPTDLVQFVASPFASFMDRLELEAPGTNLPDAEDPILSVLAAKGVAHEQAFVASLRAAGRDVLEIPNTPRAHDATREALAAGQEIVHQARLVAAPFAGFADFVVRVEGSDPPRYDVWDSKLAASVKPHYLIQLCCYADMLEQLTGTRPATLGVILRDGERVDHRTDDTFFYYLGVKQAFLDLMAGFDAADPPEPDPRADHGRWNSLAREHLERVDHLARVAGISRSQMRKLQAAGIETLTALATTDMTRVPKLDAAAYARLRKQAALQQASVAGEPPAYEIRVPSPDDPRRGLALLPPPSPMDVYFDMEGDPLVDGGLEYLFGAVHLQDGDVKFWDAWAYEPSEEQAAFERFVDWVMARWRADPTMHIYHYAPYEVSALKRLMGTYATREHEVDHLLRNHVFVDLYKVVREGVIVGTPGYSLKDVEKLYMQRDGEVESAADSIVQFELWRDSGEPADWEQSPTLRAIRDYNLDDCASTWKLTAWLRQRQTEAAIEFVPPGGPRDEDLPPLDGNAHARQALADELLQLAKTQGEAPARVSRMLAHLLEFHRREDKPIWWSFFERHDMTPEQHLDDMTCIGKARLVSGPISIKRSHGFWYEYPEQDTKIRRGNTVYIAGIQDASMEVHESEDGRICVKVGPTALSVLGSMPPVASFLQHDLVRAAPIDAAIESVARTWAETGALPPSLVNLFARQPPTVRDHAGGALLRDDEDLIAGMSRVASALENTTLVVQGPPGSGKTFTGSHVIRDLLDAGKNVGIVSNSHEAIFNLMGAVNARHDGGLTCLKIGGNREHAFFTDCPGAQRAAGGRAGTRAYTGGLVGGTAWFFAHEDMVGRLDTLFVDEAGQISLANLVGMSRAADNLVLLGDQMQLAQPVMGSHPDESGKSALEYFLDEHTTMPPDLGLFLPTTYRLHPGVCDFISGAIYEDRLRPEANTARRVVKRRDPAGGVPVDAGLLFVPVEHEGNSQASEEEVAAIVGLVQDLLGRARTNHRGEDVGPLTIEQILFVAPYNMQVRRLRAALPPEARVASVDKFQGQQAPVVIVSLCRSAGEAASSGRGLEFVLDRNRLNVAISRAQSLAIVVGDPRIAISEANSDASMQRLNLLARLIATSG